jgi:hypothetical protein
MQKARTVKRSWRVLTAALTGVTLLLTACGSSNNSSSNNQGVTKQTITIGWGWLDLGPALAAGLKVPSIGDRVKHMQSIIDAFHKEGLLPANGRDIQIIDHSYDVLNPETQRAACVAFTQQNHAFLVVGDSLTAAVLGTCAAKDNKTPFIQTDGTYASDYQQTPLLFTTQTNWNTEWKNAIMWGVKNNLFQGKKVGIIAFSDPQNQDLINNTILPELSKGGVTPAKVFTSSTSSIGGQQMKPQEADLAIQQFKQAGVNLLLAITGDGVFQSLCTSAKNASFTPTYFATDMTVTLLDHDTYACPVDVLDKAVGFSMNQAGVQNLKPDSSGWTANQRKCLDDYKSFSGHDPYPAAPNTTTPEEITLLELCDTMREVVQAIKNAGPDLTKDNFAKALETVKLTSDQMVNNLGVSFSTTRHDGGNYFRIVDYSAACRCWKPRDTSVTPLYTYP